MKYTKTIRASKSDAVSRKPVKASSTARRAVKAEDEIIEDEIIDEEIPEGDFEENIEDQGEVFVDDEASELLFETEDVAELVAEITGMDVDVTVDDEADSVTFGVGKEEYTITPEGDEEVVESSTKKFRSRKVAASRARRAARRVSASRRTSAPKAPRARK